MATAGIKLRVSVERDKLGCALTCENRLNAESLKEYLTAQFPSSKVSSPGLANGESHVKIRIEFDEAATPFAVRRALLQHPSILMPGLYDVPISERPHFRVSAESLAQWLESQGEEPWWTADGDPILMSRVAFPAPPDELATELRKIGGSVLAMDPAEIASGQELGVEAVDRACSVDDWGNRFFTFSWNGVPIEWQLIEDEPTSESYGE